MSVDLSTATDDGVLVLAPEQYVSDGDAYTLEGVTRPVPTTASTITTLVPDTAATSDPPLDVLVQGSDFVHGDRVVFGGATPPTSYHTDSELAVRVNPADWSAGALSVLVGYSTRGPSNAVPFTIT
jgi:IPT/TIG domain